MTLRFARFALCSIALFVASAGSAQERAESTPHTPAPIGQAEPARPQDSGHASAHRPSTDSTPFAPVASTEASDPRAPATRAAASTATLPTPIQPSDIVTNKLKVVADAGGVWNLQSTAGIRIDNASTSPSVAMLFGVDTASNIGILQTVEPEYSWVTRPLALQPNGGNVGIGTTAPANLVAAVGSSAKSIEIKNTTNIVTSTVLGSLIFTGGSPSYTDAVESANPGAVIRAVGDGVWGGTLPTALTFSTTKADTANFAERMRIDNAGNVGIGTTAPANKLNIVADTAGVLNAQASAGLRIDANTFLNDTALLAGVDATNNLAYIQSVEPGVSWVTRPLVLQANGGNVGIGTPSPAHKLHVMGNAHFTGTVTGQNIAARFQDLAEWVPSSEELTASTVVVLKRDASNTVVASTRAYDLAVAGVVSAQPGISLGFAGPGKVQVATTGRVKVRVDATLGSIAVGDLLVTSDIRGTAMRSEPISLQGVALHRPGTIIGKALEPMASGTGEILVLLSLQ